MNSPSTEAIAAADAIDQMLDHTMSKEEIDKSRDIIQSAIEEATEQKDREIEILRDHVEDQTRTIESRAAQPQRSEPWKMADGFYSPPKPPKRDKVSRLADALSHVQIESAKQLAAEREKVKTLVEALEDMRGYDPDRVDRWLAKVKKCS
jgi:hypothetical protein